MGAHPHPQENPFYSLFSFSFELSNTIHIEEVKVRVRRSIHSPPHQLGTLHYRIKLIKLFQREKGHNVVCINHN